MIPSRPMLLTPERSETTPPRAVNAIGVPILNVVGIMYEINSNISFLLFSAVHIIADEVFKTDENDNQALDDSDHVRRNADSRLHQEAA